MKKGRKKINWTERWNTGGGGERKTIWKNKKKVNTGIKHSSQNKQ
jgi:hypothetical protein